MVFTTAAVTQNQDAEEKIADARLRHGTFPQLIKTTSSG